MSVRRILLVAVAATFLHACGGDGGPAGPETPRVGSVLLSTTSVRLVEGGSTQISVQLFDLDGQPFPVTQANVQWTSADPAVARVTANGAGTATISAMAVGATSVTATAAGAPPVHAAVVVDPDLRVTVRVQNLLIGPTRVVINGSSVGTVPAGTTSSFEYERLSTLTLQWSLVRPTTTQGIEVGETVGGTFQALSEPRGQVDYTLDNVVGETSYFAPVVSNESAVGLLMGVNMDLQSENRCQCVVGAGSTGTYFGYYRLFSNSNVRGYRNGSGYTGSYVYWDNFASSAASGSGRVGLVATAAPVPGRGPALMPSPQAQPGPALATSALADTPWTPEP